jgi:hypothetical protein
MFLQKTEAYPATPGGAGLASSVAAMPEALGSAFGCVWRELGERLPTLAAGANLSLNPISWSSPLSSASVVVVRELLVENKIQLDLDKRRNLTVQPRAT